MNRTTAVASIAAVAVLAVLGGVWWYAAHRPAPSSPATMSMPSTPADNNSHNTTGSGNNTTAVATNSVAIQNFAFSPAMITVKKGTTVTWTNKDSTTHTVTESDGQSGPASGDVTPGSTYSYTFNTAGTYQYHCSIHPEMIGTVVVTE